MNTHLVSRPRLPAIAKTSSTRPPRIYMRKTLFARVIFFLLLSSVMLASCKMAAKRDSQSPSAPATTMQTTAVPATTGPSVDQIIAQMTTRPSTMPTTQRIVLPEFKSGRESLYNVRAFGAKGDGVTLDHLAINRAIEAAA